MMKVKYQIGRTTSLTLGSGAALSFVELTDQMRLKEDINFHGLFCFYRGLDLKWPKYICMPIVIYTI